MTHVRLAPEAEAEGTEEGGLKISVKLSHTLNDAIEEECKRATRQLGLRAGTRSMKKQNLIEEWLAWICAQDQPTRDTITREAHMLSQGLALPPSSHVPAGGTASSLEGAAVPSGNQDAAGKGNTVGKNRVRPPKD